MNKKRIKLTDYQKKLLDELYVENDYNGAIFMDMGLGKTITALKAVEDMLYYAPEYKILIVAPKRVAETTWSDELARWRDFNEIYYTKVLGTQKQRLEALDRYAEVYITNHENVAWLSEHVDHDFFNVVIVDESTYYKSYSSKRFKALRKFTKHASHVLLLSGTPAANGYEGLWSQMFLIDNGKRLGENITSYRNEYFLNYGRFYPDWRLRQGADKEIKEAIKDICFYVSADNVEGMPKNIIEYIPCGLQDKELEFYNIFKSSGRVESPLGPIEASSAGVMVQKLMQLSGGACYTNVGAVLGISKAKLERLEELVNEIGENVLIFYNFEHERDRILKHLEKFKPVVLKTDKEIKNWNAGKVKVMLAHPASAGHGLNLQQGGRHIIWFGPTFDLERFKQANARQARKGQKGTCFVHVMYSKDTVEETIIKRLSEKDLTQKDLLKYLEMKVEENKNEK